MTALSEYDCTTYHIKCHICIYYNSCIRTVVYYTGVMYSSSVILLSVNGYLNDCLCMNEQYNVY